MPSPIRPLFALMLTTAAAALAGCGDGDASRASASTPGGSPPATTRHPLAGETATAAVPTSLCRLVGAQTKLLVDDLRPVPARGEARPEAAKACFFGRPGVARDDALLSFVAYTEASVGSSLDDFRDEHEWGNSEVDVESLDDLGDGGARLAHVGMIPGQGSTQVSWTQDGRWFTLTYSGKTLDEGAARPLERMARRLAKDL